MSSRACGSRRPSPSLPSRWPSTRSRSRFGAKPTPDARRQGPDKLVSSHSCPGPPAERGAPIVLSLAHRAELVAGGRASVGPARYIGRGTWEIELQPRGTAGAPANQRLIHRLRGLAPTTTLLV